ncbi:lysophospholipid acyltransferase family protein [Mucilaginibacter glaciei]|uniref:Lysophospholipid acyltransferase family protein n=1 Tax=Mucilaginibacter glaciei TaxID=2772109 RepID=A0A926NZ41_9SPHI|nr:lysophospholipid acyltransferase family protein [Mucilaginibacter glaciei]MBD1394324.1 lysophospholipid acyltransferase family protein [Mucilaginibacter glaciei]
MIYPQQNKFIRWFFHHYILNLVQRNFQSVNFNGVDVDNDKSILLLANHFSWWDGFLMYYVNQKVFNKRYHVMVIEETMREVVFFKYIGAFSVNKNSRDILKSLDYAAELLKDPRNLVLIFPQGKLYSNFTDDINFEKGLQKITEAAAGKYQLMQVATFIESLQYKKPTVNVYLAKADDGLYDLTTMQQNYQQHYLNAKAQQIKITV